MFASFRVALFRVVSADTSDFFHIYGVANIILPTSGQAKVILPASGQAPVIFFEKKNSQAKDES